MKHFLMRYSLIVALLFVLAVVPVQAAQSYSHLYISISDALMNTKQNKEAEAKLALEQFSADWTSIKSEEIEAKAKVDDVLAQAVKATSEEERLTALSALSNALRTLEKLENPIDEAAQRAEFGAKFKPVMKAFEEVLASGDVKAIDVAYKDFNIKWNKLERPVREQSIPMYGQIETQMAFIRISLSAEETDIRLIQSQYDELKQTIEDFVAGEETAKLVEGEYSLDTLITYIDEANGFIDEGDYKAASEKIREFITIWPSVELEISTRSNSLYTKIESDMPILVSSLLKSEVEAEDIKDKLKKFSTEIELIKGDTDYTFWDSALILLREGLEALLIILALVSFLENSGQKNMRKWIYFGAVAGILLSAIA
ncbi:MAG: transporter, partial [Lysinibacillus sp.]